MARRPLLALLAAGMVALAAPASVSAESALWTLVASPLAATTGVQTTFTLTATNTDPAALLLSDSEIGCIFVDVPSNFTVQDAAVSGSNAGSGWHKDAITGNRVKIHTDSGGERLELLDWVRFTITATAWSTGSLTWSSRAYRDQDCGGSGALLSVPPIVVVAGPTVTPTPVPTPIPTPKPTVRPTPTPAPTIPLPIPLPSFPLPSMPLPSIGLPSIGPTGSPAPTPRSTSPTLRPAATGTVSPSDPPSPSGSPAPSSGTGLPGVSPPSIGGGVDSPTGVAGPAVSHDAPRLDFDAAELDIDFESTGLLNGTTVWLVPTATFAIPAVLLLLFVALQAVGALAWVPAVRRLGGRDDEVA